MQVANFGAKHGGEWAPSWRNLGGSFVRSNQKAQKQLQVTSCKVPRPTKAVEDAVNPLPKVA
jgi:hypothetical protein